MSYSRGQPFRLTVAVLMLDIETEWTLNASLRTSSSYRKCSKRRTLDHSAQAISRLQIEGTMKRWRIALGLNSGTGQRRAAGRRRRRTGSLARSEPGGPGPGRASGARNPRVPTGTESRRPPAPRQARGSTIPEAGPRPIGRRGWPGAGAGTSRVHRDRADLQGSPAALDRVRRSRPRIF